jgi:membrane protein
MKKVKEIIRKLWKIITRDEMRILPGNLAFFIVLSAIPIITLLGVIASMFSISMGNVIDFMNQTFPAEVSELLVPYISGHGFDTNVLVFMVIGFVTASNGAHSIIIASDTLYQIEPDSLLSRRIKSVFLTIILVNLFIFILVVLAFGNIIVSELLALDIWKVVTDNIYLLFILLKWPVALIVIFFVVKLIYTIAPDKKIPSRYMNRGAIFTTLGWIVVTAIYSYYVTHFANYDLFYGGLSNIIILMMWIYILSYILVIGIAINTNTYEMVENSTKHESK